MTVDLRADFLLDPSVTFLNHGSYGACPRPVFEEYQRWQLELERQPVEFLGRRYYDLLAESRAALGHYLGVDGDDLVYTDNATMGVNIVLRSLDLKPGDEIVTTDHEYGACDLAWQFLHEQNGVVIHRAPITLPVSSKDEIVQSIFRRVTERTKVIYLSHITSGSALIFPVEEICGKAREAGILTLIDGAHVPGQIPLDLTEIGADIYTGNCHKWLCAPKGSGFLHVRPEHQAWMESMIVSWGWGEGHETHRAASQFISRNQWQGTGGYAAYLTVPTAIAFQGEHDWPTVRALCHDLAAEAEARILALSGLPPISPPDPADGWPWFAQMRAIPLPPVDLPQLKRRLYEDDRIEVPMVAIPTMPLIRVSVQAYNSPADIDALVTALERILPELAV